MTRLDVDTAAFYLEVGQRLQATRKQQGLTQQQVADSVGISRGALANMETGGQGITLAMFVNLADHYGVDPGSLL